MGKSETSLGRQMALDGYITRADSMGWDSRQIKERPAPPAPMMAKAETATPAPTGKLPRK
jgi:hypothetical protein